MIGCVECGQINPNFLAHEVISIKLNFTLMLINRGF